MKRTKLFGRNGQNLRSAVGRKHSVFKVSRGRAIAGHDGPAVIEGACLVSSEVDHRLDRQSHAGLDLLAGDAPPEVRNLRRLVHRGADAVSHHVANHTQSAAFDVSLNSVGYIADAMAHL